MRPRIPEPLSTRIYCLTWRAARALARPRRHGSLHAAGRPWTDRGGATGTPTHDLDEAPPSAAQESNWVVSGGGLAGSDPNSGPVGAHRSR